MSSFDLTPGELRTLRSLRRPELIQRFLDKEIGYNKEPDGATIRSPRRVLRDRVGHCFEGALVAAAALRLQGHEPLLLDLTAVRDDDHVLAIFRQDGCWGAIAKSNFTGLRFREPVYRTLRELALSYFESYCNLAREKTLRGYGRRPVNLRRFDGIRWMTAEEELWPISDHLYAIAHAPLVKGSRKFSRVDARSFAAALVGRER